MSGLHGGHVFNQGRECCNDNDDNHCVDLITKLGLGNSLFSDLQSEMWRLMLTVRRKPLKSKSSEGKTS